MQEDTTNVTLSLPTPLLRLFRVYAAKQNRSMTSLLADAIATMVEEDGEAARAQLRIVSRLRKPPGRLPGGKISWRREEIHQR